MTASLTPQLADLVRATRGFMPEDEGELLYALALEQAPHGPLLEVGTYCGRSTVYLGAAAQEKSGTVFTVDHHRGSEENQPGWEYHDPTTVDPEFDEMDTLPFLRKTLRRAELEDTVITIVGQSRTVARWWGTPLALVFIDGGHAEVHAHNDYDGWSPYVQQGGTLVIHDVFPDPADGGRPPYDIYRRALDSGAFTEYAHVGSMRALRRH